MSYGFCKETFEIHQTFGSFSKPRVEHEMFRGENEYLEKSNLKLCKGQICRLAPAQSV